MASIIDIILQTTDRTGPGFACARANLRAFATLSTQAQQAIATYTTASNSATAQVSQMAQATQRGATVQQQATAASTAAARAVAQQAALAERLHQSELRLALAHATGATPVQILSQEYHRLSARTREAGLATDELTRRQIRARRRQ